MLRAWNWRERAAYERAIAGAWYTETFARTKRMKALKHYLLPAKPKKVEGQDAARMKADFDEAVARMGGAS